MIERVAEWVLQCARETSGPPARLAEHHRYLREYVLPPWAAFGVSEDLNRVEAVPAMLQHNDLWSANIVMSATDLTVIDWEEVRRDSLPLWDLLYFFADAFAMLDGKRFAPLDERVAYFVKLFRESSRRRDWSSNGFVALRARAPFRPRPWVTLPHSSGCRRATGPGPAGTTGRRRSAHSRHALRMPGSATRPSGPVGRRECRADVASVRRS